VFSGELRHNATTPQRQAKPSQAKPSPSLHASLLYVPETNAVLYKG